jgi:hypothetical protein
MSQLFHPSINLITRITLLALVLIVTGVGWLCYTIFNAPYVTEVGIAKAQAIPFSHQQHVGGLGLDCRYCHISVEESNSASLPSTEVCMGCHKQVAKDSPFLQAVQESITENKPLAWIRVHTLADHVYFNHAIHVKQGVACETCHGRVDQMPVVMKTQSLQMAWCLDCHRTPEKYIRPRNAVFAVGWQPEQDQIQLGKELVQAYHIQVNQLTDCSVCHR